MMKQSPVVFVFALFVASALSKGWDSYNVPSTLSSGISTALSSVPLSGALKVKPWSDTYWPSSDGGIANRWNTDNPQGFNYNLNSLAQLQSMSQDDIAALSPAEKFDIFLARYDYPLTQSEWQRCSPNDPGWEGLCHGWSPASGYYTQPNPVTMTNKDGITIPFGSSDVKALLIYYVGQYQQSDQVNFLAQRCNTDLQQYPEKANLTECADENAGSMHISFQLLAQNVPFVLDRDRGIQVWNQPAYSYSSKQTGTRSPSSGSARGTAQEIGFSTSLTYSKETYPQWKAHDPYMITETYNYWVEVDANKNVLGGSHNTWDRPDFMWKEDIEAFSGFFAPLAQIYQNSTGDATRALTMPVHAMAARRMAVNHNVVSVVGTGFGVSSYPANHRASWSIVPENQTGKVVLSFAGHTMSYRDEVKVYENHDGSGAPVATFHGDFSGTITVPTSTAYVVFTSEPHSIGGGQFKAQLMA